MNTNDLVGLTREQVEAALTTDGWQNTVNSYGEAVPQTDPPSGWGYALYAQPGDNAPTALLVVRFALTGLAEEGPVYTAISVTVVA